MNRSRSCRSCVVSRASQPELQEFGGLGCVAGIPAEPVAGQLAQNAVDMLTYPQGIGPPATAPHRALQMVRENLNYLERFVGPQSGRDPGSTRLS